MSTLKDFLAAIGAFNQRFERLAPQPMAQDLFALEGQLRVRLSKAIVEAQGFDAKARWHEVNNLPEETVLTLATEDIFQSYLEHLRMNFGIRVGKMDTFREVQQVCSGLKSYPLAKSLVPTKKQEADMTFRALCIQLANDNGLDSVEVQDQFTFLRDDLVLTPAAKALADLLFSHLETIFSPST
ncbi:MAG: hypothetical protein WCW34_05315 [Patescibacteria group bacterium]|jgi:hypothetical protein